MTLAAYAGVVLADQWHAAPGRRYFHADDVVRLKGEHGRRYRVVGFNGDIAELDTLPPRTGRRSVPALRLIRVGGEVRRP